MRAPGKNGPFVVTPRPGEATLSLRLAVNSARP
jgi:hypothetical protein